MQSTKQNLLRYKIKHPAVSPDLLMKNYASTSSKKNRSRKKIGRLIDKDYSKDKTGMIIVTSVDIDVDDSNLSPVSNSPRIGIMKKSNSKILVTRDNNPITIPRLSKHDRNFQKEKLTTNENRVKLSSSCRKK